MRLEEREFIDVEDAEQQEELLENMDYIYVEGV